MDTQESTAVIECPECKQQTLKFDSTYKLYECTNEACKLSFSEKDLAKIQDNTRTQVGETKKVRPRKPKKIKYRQVGDKPLLVKILILPFKMIWGLIKFLFWWMD